MDETTARGGSTHRRSGRPGGLLDGVEPRLLAAAFGPNDRSCAAILAGLVHELRTPVTALATGSELLLDDLDTLSRDDLQRIVESMHRGAMWLQGLIENVLFAATLAEGGVQIYPRSLARLCPLHRQKEEGRVPWTHTPLARKGEPWEPCLRRLYGSSGSSRTSSASACGTGSRCWWSGRS